MQAEEIEGRQKTKGVSEHTEQGWSKISSGISKNTGMMQECWFPLGIAQHMPPTMQSLVMDREVSFNRCCDEVSALV
jgi:hypothetical protein